MGGGVSPRLPASMSTLLWSGGGGGNPVAAMTNGGTRLDMMFRLLTHSAKSVINPLIMTDKLLRSWMATN